MTTVTIKLSLPIFPVENMEIKEIKQNIVATIRSRRPFEYDVYFSID